MIRNQYKNIMMLDSDVQFEGFVFTLQGKNNLGLKQIITDVFQIVFTWISQYLHPKSNLTFLLVSIYSVFYELSI